MSEQTTYDLPDACLLQALDKAHEKGFRDFLRDNRHDERCQADRKRAAVELEKLPKTLKGSSMPCYNDPYVVGAYLVHYHLSHCMLGYWSFKNLFDRIGVPDSIYVCDVGAGTGAGCIGLDLALSRYKEKPAVYFDACEPSDEMWNAGYYFWSAYRDSVGGNFDPDPHSTLPHRLPDNLPTNAIRVVTAFHLSLPNDGWNANNVGERAQDSLEKAFRLVSPEYGFFTCHKDKEDSLRKVVGDYYDWDKESKVSIPSGRNGVESRSTFYTLCALSLGFQVNEGAPVNTWSRHRFSLPSDSILLRCKRDLSHEREEAEQELE